MDNFITINDYDASIHREILDALLRKDTGTVVETVTESGEGGET